MFGWENNMIVLDMTPELQELCKVSKWGKKIEMDALQKKLLGFDKPLDAFEVGPR